MHRHGRVIHRAGQGDVSRGEPSALGEQNGPGLEIETLGADIAARGFRPIDRDGVAVPGRHLLDHDGVGAARHDAAGKYARRLAGSDLAVEWLARRDLADHPETGGRPRHIGGAHRIAIHGRDVGRRLGAQRREVGGEHPAMGIDQGACSAGNGAASASTSARASATESSAMLACSFRRGNGPTCRRSSRPAGSPRCVIPRSTAFTMS